MASGKTIKLFMMDGGPNGRTKCSLANWTGVAYRVPRTAMQLCKDMDILKQSGVYFLFGTDINDEPVVYVGQACVRKNGEGIYCRVSEPHTSIDYWDETVMFTTTGNTLGPTEISYLENKFYNIALSAKRCKVINGNDPNPGNVTEETESELDEFIEYAKLVMGALGYDTLEPINQTSAGSSQQNQLPQVYLKTATVDAKGQCIVGGFILFSGSKINNSTVTSCPDSALKARKDNRDKIDANYCTTEDILFSSPSGAASFVLGYSASGNKLWKDANGTELGKLL